MRKKALQRPMMRPVIISVAGLKHLLDYRAEKYPMKATVLATTKLFEICVKLVVWMSTSWSPITVMGRAYIRATTKLSCKVALTSASSGGPFFMRFHSSLPASA